MISNEEIVDFWGKENLTCSKNKIIQIIKIPKSSKKFLSEIGLPSKALVFNGFTFNLAFKKSSIQEKSLIYKLPPDFLKVSSDLWVIGAADDYWCFPVCIKENSRQIFCICWSDDSLTEIVFVNSSVQQLSKYLTAIKRFYDQLEENEWCGYKYVKLARSLKKQLKEIDPKALKSEQNWWSIPLQEMCSDMS